MTAASQRRELNILFYLINKLSKNCMVQKDAVIFKSISLHFSNPWLVKTINYEYNVLFVEYCFHECIPSVQRECKNCKITVNWSVLLSKL